MQNYIVNNADGYLPQPMPTVKQMPPTQAGAIDPKMLQAAMEQIAMQRQQPMSSGDGVTITIQIEPDASSPVNMQTDAYMQQGDAFAESQMGRSIMERNAGVEIPDRSKIVHKRATDLMSQALNGFTMPDTGYGRPPRRF